MNPHNVTTFHESSNCKPRSRTTILVFLHVFVIVESRPLVCKYRIELFLNFTASFKFKFINRLNPIVINFFIPSKYTFLSVSLAKKRMMDLSLAPLHAGAAICSRFHCVIRVIPFRFSKILR